MEVETWRNKKGWQGKGGRMKRRKEAQPMFPLFPSGVFLKAAEKTSHDPPAHWFLIRSLVRDPFLKLKHTQRVSITSEDLTLSSVSPHQHHRGSLMLIKEQFGILSSWSYCTWQQVLVVRTMCSSGVESFQFPAVLRLFLWTTLRTNVLYQWTRSRVSRKRSVLVY